MKTNYFIKQISSKDNDIFKSLVKLRTKRNKELFIIEGHKIILEAFAHNYEFEYIVINEEKETDIINKVNNTKFISLPENLYKRLSINKDPSECLAVVRTKQTELKDYENYKNILFLDNLQDPGNVGTIIRTGAGLGVDLIILNNCAYLTNDKVIKSSMGAIFKQDVLEVNGIEELKNIKSKGFDLISTTLSDKSIYLDEFKEELNKKVIIIGNEGHGISKEILDLSNIHIKIRLHNNVESFNAAIAACIVMYELINK